MTEPLATDCAPVWQAYVAAGIGRDERLRRFDRVPPDLRPRVASHMRTVQAVEAFHRKRKLPRLAYRKHGRGALRGR